MKQNIQSKKRIIGLDILKILACLGVVSLHTVFSGKSMISREITNLATLSIPFFFTISGYLMFQKEHIEYKYALKKILNILLVCFAWEALHALAYFLYYHEFRNFLASFFLDFLQKGLFYHFWYMGGLILMYLSAPLLDKLYHYSASKYKILLVMLGILNGALDVFCIVMGKQFILAVPQSLRIHFWLFYIMLGGWISRNPDVIQKVCSRLRTYYLVLALLLMIVYLHVMGTILMDRIIIEAFYGAFPVQFAVTVVFLQVLSIKTSARMEKLVSFAVSLTMGIYIMHPFVLAVLRKFIPVFTEAGAGMNLMFWVVTTLLCGFISAVCLRIPVLNRLLKL